MAMSVYKTKAAMVIFYGTKQKGENVIPVIRMQFAPFLKANDNGFGQQYDWVNKKISFSFALDEILKLTVSIELSLRDNNWTRCKIYHQYKNADGKSLMITNSGDTYFIGVISGQLKVSIALTLVELLALKKYLESASLDAMKKDGEMYYNTISNQDKKESEYEFASDDNSANVDTKQPNVSIPQQVEKPQDNSSKFFNDDNNWS